MASRGQGQGPDWPVDAPAAGWAWEHNQGQWRAARGGERLQARSQKGTDGYSVTICRVLPHFGLNYSQVSESHDSKQQLFDFFGFQHCLCRLSYYHCLVL